MRDHPGLVVAAGRLRARRRDREAALRDALRWAFEELKTLLPPRLAANQARAVPLGEDEAAVPLYCWVVLEDAKALVSFDDTQRVGRRIELAGAIYGLSPAQVRLARLIVDGHDLAAASEHARRQRQHAADPPAADVRPHRRAQPGGAGAGAPERGGADEVAGRHWTRPGIRGNRGGVSPSGSADVRRARAPLRPADGLCAERAGALGVVSAHPRREGGAGARRADAGVLPVRDAGGDDAGVPDRRADHPGGRAPRHRRRRRRRCSC